ncbi:glycoside hydrolase family 43 protein [Enterococcus casseliflavus]|uniref:glycoside hydrolase family 43 protein n=1 Tax=Enterococcus casseliflavus TaxID=37734 RepID=UPI00035396DC|nr:glycoside hydrolase family 43 protein [Enterococcus casseliflavus]EPH97632.1 glycosyl hydrolase, family 43 [Enterococcus faecalis 06-MB-DW-09]NKD31630.1 family 43 glycosylhydrolase [Enterococcus casseliflavus]
MKVVSKKGDDFMIQNPILKGFNPDPSICKRGDTYYIATSTFEWFPGVQIYESKDLKNWRLLVRPLNRISQLDMVGVPDSGGVWAPCLTYEDGKFWLVYSIMREHRAFKDVRNYLVTADDIEGPWSEPIFLNASGFDPSLFHDNDGKKYLLNMIYDFRNDHPWNYGIAIQEFDEGKEQLVGKPEIIFKGTHLEKTEGPHIYFINGYYYLFTAEGGSQWGHSVTVARSKSLYGPYEVHPDNPILTAWYSPENDLQKTGHASLIKTDSEEWYIAYLASRPIKRKGKGLFEERGFCTLGRESALAKIEWTPDDWPIVTGGKVAQKYVPKPNLPECPWSSKPKKNYFASGIPSEFQTLRIPFSQKMGQITKKGLILYGQESLYSVFEQSLLARRFESVNFIAETAVDFSPSYFQQSAGLVCYYNSKNWTSLQVTANEQLGKVLTILKCEGAKLSWPLRVPIVLTEEGNVYLRVKVNARFYQFFYSLDGKNWKELSFIFDTYKLSDDYITKPFLGPTGSAFTGAFVGVHCNDLTGMRQEAAFEYFSYQDIEEDEVTKN